MSRPGAGTGHQERAAPTLTAICGPMFSGKSSELIRRLRSAAEAGVAVRAIKPRLDTRYADGEIVTHAGERLTAVSVATALEIELAAGDAELIGIDEAHFFGAGLTAVCVRLIGQGRSAVVAGLERDHRGEAFEPFPHLLCEADEVIKLTCPCSVCGGPSVHSQRMVASEARIVVGGAEAYEPRCRRCFGK
ncbi:MAG: thymidine kinase [Phycisphaerales bacterium]|nr:thymidine kinase [Phycisphaerales bacterium]